MRTIKLLLPVMLPVAVFSLMSITLNAAIVVNGVNVSSGNSQATAATYTPDIVATDLINNSQATLSSWTRDKTPFFESITLNDGNGMPSSGSTLGTYLTASLGGGDKLPFTYTFYLNTALNPKGYDITKIISFAGWNVNGSALGDQKYELWVRFIGTTTFVSLGTYAYTPFDSSHPDTASATKMTLTESAGGAIAQGVDAVRFVLMNHGFVNGNTAVDGTVYYEIDVIGTPTTDSPITVSSYSYDGNGSASAPSTSPAWPDSGGIEWTDGILPPSSAYTNPQWIGFKDDAPDDGLMSPRVRFDLGRQYDLSSVRIDYLQNGGVASITPPEEVRISVSRNGTTWSPVEIFSGFDTSPGNAVRSTLISLAGKSGRYVRLDFRNTSQWSFFAEATFRGTALSSDILALPVDISNASFQEPLQANDGDINIGAVTGWTESGTTIGNFNPNQSFYSDYYIIDNHGTGGAICDMAGNNVLFFSNSGAGAYVSQTLAHTMVRGIKYTLTVAVGDRDNADSFGGYSIGLLSGGTYVTNRSSLTSAGPGSFIDTSVEYTTQMSDVGNALEVRLGMVNAGTQVDYDNVRLSAELIHPVTVVSYTYDGSGPGAQPSTNPAFPDSGGNELINGKLPASTDFNDSEWVGFKDDNLDGAAGHPRIRFDLGDTVNLEVAQVVFLHSTTQAGGTITSPESVWVSVSSDGTTWSTPVQRTSFDSSAGDAIRTCNIDLSGLSGRYVRLDLRNTSQWTFLTEVTFGRRVPRRTVFIFR